MNLNLTPDEVRDVKNDFDAWDEIETRKKELAAEIKAVLARSAAIYECKHGKVSKLFKGMKKKMENGEDEVSDLSLMEEVIRNNGE